MSGDTMIPMTLATPVLHLADEGGGSGGSGWWWLLLLLIVPVAVGGWLYAKRDRTKNEIVHPPRPESNDPALPKVNLAAPEPQPAPQAPAVPAGPTGGAAEVSLNPAPSPKKTVSGDGVGSYLNADGERVPVPIGGHLPLVADAQQAPDGYPIKGDADTGLYHVPDDPWFGDVIAAVWLASEPAARAAGFKRAGSEPEQSAEQS